MHVIIDKYSDKDFHIVVLRPFNVHRMINNSIYEVHSISKTRSDKWKHCDRNFCCFPFKPLVCVNSNGLLVLAIANVAIHFTPKRWMFPDDARWLLPWNFTAPPARWLVAPSRDDALKSLDDHRRTIPRSTTRVFVVLFEVQSTPSCNGTLVQCVRNVIYPRCATCNFNPYIPWSVIRKRHM